MLLRAGIWLTDSASGSTMQKVRIAILGKPVYSAPQPQGKPFLSTCHLTRAQGLAKGDEQWKTCERMWMNQCIFLTTSWKKKLTGQTLGRVVTDSHDSWTETNGVLELVSHSEVKDYKFWTRAAILVKDMMSQLLLATRAQPWDQLNVLFFSPTSNHRMS